MVKKFLVGCLVLLIILPASFSCSSAKAPAAALIPGTANVVVQIQVAKILTNPALKIAYGELAKAEQAWPQTTDDALNQLLQKTGFDLSSVSTAVFFANIQSTNQTRNTYAGLIASGTFNESALTAKIQQQTKQTLTTGAYKGFTVYTGMQDKFEIAFLSQSQLVLGTPQAVRDTIDVNKGDKKPLSGGIIDALGRFGTAFITGAFAPPESIRNQLVRVLPQQSLLSPKSFPDIDTIGFAVDQPDLSLSIRIDAHFTNPASIQDARNVVTGLISIGKGTIQDPNIKTALGKIKVSTSDSWLSTQGLISAADFTTIIGGIQTQK